MDLPPEQKHNNKLYIWQSNNEKIKTILFVWFKELSTEMLAIVIKT